jgi:hypothetical protein
MGPQLFIELMRGISPGIHGMLDDVSEFLLVADWEISGKTE